MKPTLNW